MQKDSGLPLRVLKVDGGAAANDLLMQFQADLLGIEIVRPKLLETTALGAALLAGLAVQVWKGTDEARRAWTEDRRFKPELDKATVAAHLARWQQAVARA